VQRLLSILREASGQWLVTPSVIRADIGVIVGGSSFSVDGSVTPRIQVGETTASGTQRLSVVAASGNDVELLLRSNRAIVQRVSGANARYVWRDLSVGEDRMYFDIDGSVSFPRQHYSIRSRSTAQSIPDNAWTTLDFTTTEVQQGITGSGTTFTTATSGVYLIIASVGWAAGGGTLGLRVRVGGTPVRGMVQAGDNANGQTLCVSAIANIGASVNVSAQAFQLTGAARNTAADATLTYMMLIKIA
jgi:hypothetical protein